MSSAAGGDGGRRRDGAGAKGAWEEGKEGEATEEGEAPRTPQSPR